MAETIGSVAMGVTADMRQFQQQVVAGAKQTGDKAGQELDRTFGARINKLKADFQRKGGLQGALLGGIGLGAGFGAFQLVTKGIGMVTDLLGDMSKAASDNVETLAKLGEVFPTLKAEMVDWSRSAATSLGISEQAAQEAAATFGNFLQAMGETEKPAADMSRAMVQLASDLGSFNNVDPSEVLQALQAGIAGQTKPLRRFGIDISDSAVKAELLRQGLHAVGGQFTQTQKIAGRYALIMRQTSKAQGDFARTSDGTANKTRIAAATIEDLKGKMGELVNNVVNVAESLAGTGALALTAALDAVGVAWNDLMRLMNPTLALQQDMDKELRRQAELMGLNSDALMAFNESRRREAQATHDAAEARRISDDEYINSLGILDITLEQRNQLLDEWHKSQQQTTDDTDTATAATDNLTDAQKAATAVIQAFILAGMPVPKAMTDIATGADDAGAGLTDLTAAAKTVPPVLGDIADIVTATFVKVPAKTKKGMDRIKIVLHHALTDAKKEARLRTAELEDILEHRQDRGKLEKEYRREINKARNAMKTALRTGNASAYYQAKTFVDDTTAKLKELTDEDWIFTVNMVLGGFGGGFTGHGGSVGQTIIDALNKAGARVANPTKPPKKAAGGYVAPWTTYQVNERGGVSEMLHMAGRSGYISPAPVTATGGMSGHLTIEVIDRDGGLARAGVTSAGLASDITQTIRRWRT